MRSRVVRRAWRTRRTPRTRRAGCISFAAFCVAISTPRRTRQRIWGPWEPYFPAGESEIRTRTPNPARSCIKRTLKINCAQPRMRAYPCGRYISYVREQQTAQDVERRMWMGGWVGEERERRAADGGPEPHSGGRVARLLWKINLPFVPQ